MANKDHGREWLAASYAQKSDLELVSLAGNQRVLTEEAVSALEAEFAKRGIPFEREALAISDEAEVKLIPIRRFRDLPQALVAKGLLESAGLKCFLSDENTIRMDWMWSNALGGVRLWVREDDLPEAATLLSPEYSEYSGDAGVDQPER